MRAWVMYGTRTAKTEARLLDEVSIVSLSASHKSLLEVFVGF